MTVTQDDELDDLLPDELSGPVPPPKHKAAPLVRSKKHARALAKAAERKAEADRLAAAQSEAQAAAARLAQIVNLHIAGFSLADIGAQIGASADEVDRMLTSDAQRYIRNQPALRTYVRNWVSSKYMTMIEADWDAAKDPNHKEKLENQDRVIRMLDRMAKLHGADAPTQTEVKVDAAPEAVERLVNALAASQGLGYDPTIFDVVDAEVVHEASDQVAGELAVSGNAVEESDGHDEF